MVSCSKTMFYKFNCRITSSNTRWYTRRKWRRRGNYKVIVRDGQWRRSNGWHWVRSIWSTGCFKGFRMQLSKKNRDFIFHQYTLVIDNIKQHLGWLSFSKDKTALLQHFLTHLIHDITEELYLRDRTFFISKPKIQNPCNNESEALCSALTFSICVFNLSTR